MGSKGREHDIPTPESPIRTTTNDHQYYYIKVLGREQRFLTLE